MAKREEVTSTLNKLLDWKEAGNRLAQDTQGNLYQIDYLIIETLKKRINNLNAYEPVNNLAAFSLSKLNSYGSSWQFFADSLHFVDAVDKDKQVISFTDGSKAILKEKKWEVTE